MSILGLLLPPPLISTFPKRPPDDISAGTEGEKGRDSKCLIEAAKVDGDVSLRSESGKNAY